MVAIFFDKYNIVMIFFYIILIYGHTNIITQSEIFEPIRDWANKVSHFLGSLFSCPMCMGFWVGVFWSAMNQSPAHIFFEEVYYIEYFKYLIDGVMGSSIAWIMHTIISSIAAIRDSQKEKILRMIEELEDSAEIFGD